MFHGALVFLAGAPGGFRIVFDIAVRFGLEAGGDVCGRDKGRVWV